MRGGDARGFAVRAGDDLGEQGKQAVAEQWKVQRLGAAAGEPRVVGRAGGLPGVEGGAEALGRRLGVSPADAVVDGLGHAAMRPRAMTGAPQARASIGTMPKSSSPGKSRARARR